MKKQVRIVGVMFLLLSISPDLTQAQKFWLQAGAGYGFGTGSQNLPGFYNSTYNNDSATVEQVNVSLGKGTDFRLSAGYMFGKHLGAELGIGYLTGTTTEAKKVSGYGTTRYSYSAKVIQLFPSVVFSPGLTGKVNPYVKLGIVLASGWVRNDLLYDDDSIVGERSQLMQGGIGFGFTATAGVEVKLYRQLSCFAEVNLVSLSYAPRKGKLTVATDHGKDMLPEMKIRDKETEYVKKFTYDYRNTPPDDQPAKVLKQQLPLSSIGISAGILIHF